ncbi:restriction endonuclease [Paramicrobacterium agarici]|uniref:Restriction endonuclease Mrr n=1 Tax=Paramicrobacterium agarici TaxID=630514 RepID=A0A2A9DX75_9MICO|nr:restriction endonuclease [Microbacterium agarici]PFG31184.1 restriction endonuclease Mrr [Microbacterium agarici]
MDQTAGLIGRRRTFWRREKAVEPEAPATPELTEYSAEWQAEVEREAASLWHTTTSSGYIPEVVSDYVDRQIERVASRLSPAELKQRIITRARNLRHEPSDEKVPAAGSQMAELPGEVPRYVKHLSPGIAEVIGEAAALWKAEGTLEAPAVVLEHIDHRLETLSSSPNAERAKAAVLAAAQRRRNTLATSPTAEQEELVEALRRESAIRQKKRIAALRAEFATAVERLRQRLEAEAEAQAARTAQAEKLRQRLREAEEQRRLEQEAEQQRLLAEEEERRLRWLNRPAPAPAPQPYGVSHEGAEHLVVAWMRHLGVLDAEVTQFSGDGGIDVASAQYIAQVKNYAGSVPVIEVRAFFGVAIADEKSPIFFTSGSVTSEGQAFADRVGMALIHYNAEEAVLTGLNSLGAQCVEFSIPQAFTRLNNQLFADCPKPATPRAHGNASRQDDDGTTTPGEARAGRGEDGAAFMLRLASVASSRT